MTLSFTAHAPRSKYSKSARQSLESPKTDPYNHPAISAETIECEREITLRRSNDSKP